MRAPGTRLAAAVLGILLALGTAVAALTFASLFYLIQRLRQRSPQAPGT